MSRDNSLAQEVQRRSLHQPSIVVWLGVSLTDESVLLDALPGCRVLAIYEERQSLRFVQELQRRRRVDGRIAAPISSPESARDWAATLVPVFFLNGTAVEELTARQRTQLRVTCETHVADRFAAEIPLHVLVGYDDPGSISQVLELILEADARTPCLIVGGPEKGADTSVIRQPGVEIFADWGQMERWLGQLQVRFGDEIPAELLYGSRAVQLDRLFEDEDIRIDDAVRLIQRRALEAPARPDLTRLFRAFMVPDEERRSKDVFVDPSPLWDRDRAFHWFLPLLQNAATSPVTTRFAELVSYELLHGTDDPESWKHGGGEARVKGYELLPPELVSSSRSPLHHQANVLRRSCWSEMLDREEKVQRLERALSLLDSALELPWKTGVRDEHPGHIRTTKALVAREREELVPGTNGEAVRLLEEALLEVPESRHTRLALAKVHLETTKRLRRDRPEQSMASAAEVLSVLSVEPTGKIETWIGVKADSVGLFSSPDARVEIELTRPWGARMPFFSIVSLASTKA